MVVGESITIPSPIDIHTHLREPGGEEKETIATGTFAALAGGYQAVFDMPNNPSPYQTWSEEELDRKIGIARTDAYTDIGFYAGVDIDNPAYEEFPGMVRKAAGLKLYMGHTTGNTKEHDLDAVRPIVDAWIAEARTVGISPPILLHAREEIGSETAQYIAGAGYPVHWCHIATKTEVRAATALTMKFPAFYTGGVTPHHLTMTARNADFQQGWNARMQPPLGSEADAEELLYAYNSGLVQILETDHAPHTKTDKLRAEGENPAGDTDPSCTTCFGVSGIELVLPVMTGLVRRGQTTMERVVDSLHHQPLRMLGIGAMAAAHRAETRLRWEPHVIAETDVVGKSSNTPYIGWMAGARVESVVRCGKHYSPKELAMLQGRAAILHQSPHMLL